MKSMIKNTLTMACLACSATLAAAPDTQQIVLTLEPDSESVGKQVSYAETVRRSGTTEVVTVSGDGVEASINLLEQRVDVIEAERNAVMRTPDVETTPIVESVNLYNGDPDADYNDPLFPQQYAFNDYDADNPGASTVAKAIEQAVEYEPVTVVVIDGGFNSMGTDFEWKDGYNFIDDSGTSGGLAPGSQFRTPPSDCQPHGQWVGSVISGVRDDGVGNAGVLGEVNMYAARTQDCSGIGDFSLTAEAVKWAVGEPAVDDNGDAVPTIPEKADIINMSISGLTGTCPSALQNAIDDAIAAGAVVTVSSGNVGSSNETNTIADDRSPGNCDGVVSTTGTDINGEPGGFSHGDTVDMSAAGVEVPATSSEGSTLVTGTSFAAPLVAGIVANLRQDVPGLDPNTITATLLPNAVNNPDGMVPKMGAGLIDANKLQREAVNLINPPDFELAHPADGQCGSQAMLDFIAKTDGSVCDLREVTINEDLNGHQAVIFELPAEADMTVSSAKSKGSVFKASDSDRFLLDGWSESKQYGVQKCDDASGNGCEDDALIPLDPSSVTTQCST